LSTDRHPDRPCICSPRGAGLPSGPPRSPRPRRGSDTPGVARSTQATPVPERLSASPWTGALPSRPSPLLRHTFWGCSILPRSGADRRTRLVQIGAPSGLAAALQSHRVPGPQAGDLDPQPHRRCHDPHAARNSHSRFGPQTQPVLDLAGLSARVRPAPVTTTPVKRKGHVRSTQAERCPGHDQSRQSV